MLRNLKIYRHLIHAAILSKLQYKVDFVVGVINILILNAVNISLLGIMVYNFNSMNGWDIWELMFLYSLWMMSRGIYSIFFWHINDLEEMIVNGGFDAYLIRPISPFVQLLGKDINYMGFGDALVGVLGFIVVVPHLALNWSWHLWLYFIICILSGTLIQVAINWICASICFWTTRSRTVSYITERFTVLMQQYPVDIFGKWFQAFVTCFLPVAFINYYPSVILLGKSSLEEQMWKYLSPLVSIIFLFIAAFIWVRGVRKYSGTGN